MSKNSWRLRIASIWRRLALWPRSVIVERRHGLVFVAPCYYVRPTFPENSSILDCGTGCDANFSQAMIRRFDVRSIGVDPTRKHHPGLYHLASELAGRFRLLPYALGITNGGATFYESGENESGSLYSDHRNIENDSIVAYDVEVINLAQLVREAGPGHVELLKLDVEGGEFGILSDAGPELANTFPQIIVEFHHDVVGRWKFADSQRLVRRLGTLGYQWHSRDAINYLFFRP